VGAWGVSASMRLADARRGRVEGMLGNFDGNPANDIAPHGGRALAQPPPFATLYPAFADSWRVARSLFDYGPGQSTATFTDRAFPHSAAELADAAARSAAEAICRNAGVFDLTTLQNCILDVGLTGQPAFASDAAAAQS